MVAAPTVQAGNFSARPDDATLAERLASPDAKIRRRAAERVVNLPLDAKRAYLPQLLALIGDPDRNVEGTAVTAMCVMGSPAKQVIPMAIRNFSRGDSWSQKVYAKCLRIFGGALVLRPVMKALDDKKFLIRKGALLTLRNLGYEAAPALPRLRALLAAPRLRLDVSGGDEAPRFESVILTDSVRAAMEAIEARPTLEERLLSTDRTVRFHAVSTVAGLSPDGTIRYFRTVLGLLGDTDGSIRSYAGEALGDLSMRTDIIIPALIQALDVPNGEEIANRSDRIAQFGARAIPHLIRGLQDSKPKVREHSLELLEKYGPAASAALPTLQELAQRSRSRHRVDQAIAAITAPPTLKGRVESPNEITRWRAFREVRALAPTERTPFVPFYVDYLRRNEGILRFPEVARMLCNTGPPAKAAIPILIRRFVETRPHAVRTYGECVAGFGRHAVPALIDALSDTKYLIRLRAIETLQRIGPSARAALPALAALSDNPPLRLDVAAYAAPPRIETVNLAPAAKHAIAAISAKTDGSKRQ